ncbi:MAG TPA: MaoC family dehydratase N-terminal domain-containing protein [Ideonella sp.]|jgi:3-methylfumaryl-CoA hydratase|nr:MaoC family dehydratase N-terminal domain-containing protein [Ideonella sp.]
MDLDNLRQWIGQSERRHDCVSSAPLAGFAALLDHEGPELLPGMPAPLLAHWLFFTPTTRQSEIGPDGHARRGGFLPPVPLPRRMWAGGRFEFMHPLHVGDEIERVSTVQEVNSKPGREGPLVFVTVHHELRNPQGLALTEEHDIVYRAAPLPGAEPAAAQAAPTDEAFSRRIVPDPVLLFRYSALTFNSHRIHYDRSYAIGIEGYPGLVVHGPLIATLLLDLLLTHEPQARVRHFMFRALKPLFDIYPFEVCGRVESRRRVLLWARDHEGALAMQAQVDLAP